VRKEESAPIIVAQGSELGSIEVGNHRGVRLPLNAAGRNRDNRPYSRRELDQELLKVNARGDKLHERQCGCVKMLSRTVKAR
jgi:hypothetical protein